MADYMGNFAYLEEVLGIKPSNSEFMRLLDKMEQDVSHWWYELRNNPVELAARQIDESDLLADIERFRQGVQKVLGKSVSRTALLQRDEAIIKEFKEKYKEYKK